MVAMSVDRLVGPSVNWGEYFSSAEDEIPGI